MAEEAGAPMLTGAESLKAALDLDWGDPDERATALVRVLEALDAVEAYLHDDDDDVLREEEAPAATFMGIARRVREQDVLLPQEEGDGGAAAPLAALRRGVARERLVSVEDPQMRHGRIRARACASRATSATSCAIWTRGW